MLKQGARVTAHPTSFDDLLALCPLRSGGFIVTVFGDVAFPADGELWIGHLIDLCAELGISESLVRTSMSRLVAGGQLTGIRRGRRSYYALTDTASAEFEQAAKVIYSGPSDSAWRFVYAPDRLNPDQFGRMGMVALTAHLAFGPAHDSTVPKGAVAFTANADGTAYDLLAMVEQVFPLDALAQDYLGFITLAQMIADLPALEPKPALQARLVLTHAFRRIALRDPRLPATVLPMDHPVRTARAAFAKTYLALCPAADIHVRTMLDPTGASATTYDKAMKYRQDLLLADLPEDHLAKSGT
jgi:phenylacetic acid degradation operon negative regulatory protein